MTNVTTGFRRKPRTTSRDRTDDEAFLVESIGVLLYPQVSEQDSLAPAEIFKGAAAVLRGDIAPWQREGAAANLRVETVSIDPGVVTMQMGTQVVPDATMDTSTLYDILYIPGGVGSGALAGNQTVLEWIRKHKEAGKVVAANCSGVGVLARSGVAGELEMTSVAAIGRGLREEGFDAPRTRRMWVGHPEEKIWTATGSYGVNGSCVALIAHYFGREVGTIVSMMFDTLAGIGDAIFDTVGPEFFVHEELEVSFQNFFQDMLLPQE